jgi:hypothetical protein
MVEVARADPRGIAASSGIPDEAATRGAFERNATALGQRELWRVPVRQRGVHWLLKPGNGLSAQAFGRTRFSRESGIDG